jgi:hypothetical protein
VSVGGTLTAPTVALTNINVSGTINAVGAIAGGNLNTAGTINATGNIAGGNLNTSGTLGVTGTSTFTGQIGATYVLVNNALYINTGAVISNAVGGAGVPIAGATNGVAAAAGQVGEYQISSVALGSAVALTTGVSANMTSIILSAGDWEVSGVVKAAGTATTVTSLGAGINTVSATMPTIGGIADGASSALIASAAGIALGCIVSLNPVRMLLSAATTVYMVALANFAGGTNTVYGHIAARRVR